MAPIAPMQLEAAKAYTAVDHRAALDIDSIPFSQRLSGIICTIGEFDYEMFDRQKEFLQTT